MQATMVSDWWPSAVTTDPNQQQPITVPWQTDFYWRSNVKTWALNVDAAIGGVPVVSISGLEIGWNFTNTRQIDPALPGFPTSEGHLCTGWAMRHEIFSVGSVAFDLNFYDAGLGQLVREGQGSEYVDYTQNVLPFLQIGVVGGGAATFSSRTGGSAFAGTVDGVPVTFSDAGLAVSGSFTLDPFELWDYTD